MTPSRKLQVVDSDTDARAFFDKFVATRTPVIIDGLLDDPSFTAPRKWTDMKYLSSKAGHVQVMVEPMHKPSNQFGTGIERISMPFKDFLESLNKKHGPYNYLTTQYADEDENDDGGPGPSTMFPPPTNALLDDFPVTPRLTGNLVLDQVNLWVGRSAEGASSGLHHDFHDNVYCLLRGRKRFVLYPPSATPHLYPHGQLDTIHPNGLISYAHHPVRGDGLSLYQAAKFRMDALKKKLAMAKARKVVRPMEVKTARKAYEKARAAFQNEHGLKGSKESDADDADAILARLEAAEVEAEAKAESEEDEWGGLGSTTTAAGDSSNDQPSEDPSSFSQIPTAILHAHLALPTSALPPPNKTLANFSDIKKAGEPFIVDLKVGQMLYLPASWWHEVTSFAASEAEGGPHMAFNYWFHPPDAATFELPYKDSVVWKYLAGVAKQVNGGGTKRKREGLDGGGGQKKRVRP